MTKKLSSANINVPPRVPILEIIPWRIGEIMANQYEELMTAITSISHSFKRARTEETKKAGLRGSDATILLELAVNPDGLSNVQLSEICDMDKAAVSRQVKKLNDDGWIRTIKNNGKRYGALHVLTSKGKKLADKIQNSGTELLSNKNSGLTKKDLSTLKDLLNQLAKNLKPE